jgi:hypothetical protein
MNERAAIFRIPFGTFADASSIILIVCHCGFEAAALGIVWRMLLEGLATARL